MNLEKLKYNELLEVALSMSNQHQIKFKKTIHGKNKSTLIDFIQNINNNYINYLFNTSKNNLIIQIKNSNENIKNITKINKLDLIKIIIFKNEKYKEYFYLFDLSLEELKKLCNNDLNNQNEMIQYCINNNKKQFSPIDLNEIFDNDEINKQIEKCFISN
jgi:hypothetical protein